METKNVLITESYQDEPEAYGHIITNCHLTDINNPKALKIFLLKNILNNYLDVCEDANDDNEMPNQDDVNDFIDSFKKNGKAYMQNPGFGPDQSIYTFRFFDEIGPNGID